MKNQMKIFIQLILCLASPILYAKPEKHLIDGRLAQCPDKPNCVNTENNDLPAISFGSLPPESAWNIVQTVIKEQGGKIIKADSTYIWATFETPMIKFTDDVEARIDKKERFIHLRSASRVGYYDFNTNKKRLKGLINSISTQLNRAKKVLND